MHLSYKNGLTVSDHDLKLTIDPIRGKSTSDLIMISHAHSDHAKIAKTNQGKYLVSDATKSLLYEKVAAMLNFQSIGYNNKQKLGPFTISLHDSGHILGSTQFLIENSSRLLFSGDIKLQDSLITKAAEPKEADTLVVDSTFGLPKYSFPEREEVYEEMASWCKDSIKENKFIILAGYALGKAQELTKFCNDYLKEVPLVYPTIFKNNQIYEKHNVNLGDYYVISAETMAESNILICPPHLVDKLFLQGLSLSLNKKITASIATGWAQDRYYGHIYDKTFPLSDHSDFESMLEYISACNPKQVLTHHGYSEQFAHYINKFLHVPARDVKHLNQKSLVEY